MQSQIILVLLFGLKALQEFVLALKSNFDPIYSLVFNASPFVCLTKKNLLEPNACHFNAIVDIQ